MSGMQTPAKVPSAAQGFGYAGLVPLAAGAIAVWTEPVGEVVVIAAAMLAYSATVLSFLGGVRWGLVLLDGQHRRMNVNLVIGIAPPLLAWVMLLIPHSGVGMEWGVLGMAVAFAAMLLSDLQAAKDGSAPPWYGQLRTPLTLAADVLLLIIFAALLVRL